MSINLGPIKLDSRQVIRQLQRDLRDDWFPDSLRYEDIFSNDHIESVLTENFSRNNGIYQPSERQLLNIPKSNLTLRYALETSIVDRAIYHGLTASLVPYFDPLIPWNVFSHRYAEKKDGRYLFKQPIKAWQDFTGTARESLATAPVLLSTDLSNYFENISTTQLKESLLNRLGALTCDANDKATIRSSIDLLFSYLSFWSHHKDKGLPQNRDASSFLANMYMLPIDEYMCRAGYRYFRYMDDIKIICADEYEARAALKHLSLELRKLGLSINSGKTKITHADDAAAIADCLDAGSHELQEIAASWDTRRLLTISRTLPSLRERVLRILKDGLVDTREFRYYVRRLRALATCPEFEVPPDYFLPISDRIVEEIPRYPAATDQLVTYLKSVDLNGNHLSSISTYLCDGKRSIYNWQNYRLWQLVTHKHYRDERLIQLSKELVKSDQDTPSRSGATLYLGALGDDDGRIHVAKHFHLAKSFLGQRNGLVAVHCLSFTPLIAEHVAPHVRDDLRNVYRHLHRDPRGYTMPDEPISITSILDMERSYE